MDSDSLPSTPVSKDVTRHKETSMRVRVRSLEMPPVKDGLVIGKSAAIGIDAMLRTLSILTHEEFERLHFSDDIIDDIIVKTSVLRKAGRERLVKFIVTNLRPIMTATELLVLDIYIELIIEDTE